MRRLRPRYRARALAAIAEEIHETLSAMPDKEIWPPWLINRLLGWEVFPLPARVWGGLAEEVPCRVIG